MLEVSIQDHLEVAHYMTDYPEGHPNRRVHGHSYVLTVTVRSEGDVDFVEEYNIFKEKVDSVVQKFDHSCVNDWGLGTGNATMESMCVFLWPQFQEVLPQLHRIMLERPTLKMTVVYEGKKR